VHRHLDDVEGGSQYGALTLVLRRRRLTAIKPLLRSPLSLREKLILYKTYIRPVMTYAYAVWAFIPK
jgi:hypothetical protein